MVYSLKSQGIESYLIFCIILEAVSKLIFYLLPSSTITNPNNLDKDMFLKNHSTIFSFINSFVIWSLRYSLLVNFLQQTPKLISYKKKTKNNIHLEKFVLRSSINAIWIGVHLSALIYAIIVIYQMNFSQILIRAYWSEGSNYLIFGQLIALYSEPIIFYLLFNMNIFEFSIIQISFLIFQAMSPMIYKICFDSELTNNTSGYGKFQFINSIAFFSLTILCFLISLLRSGKFSHFNFKIFLPKKVKIIDKYIFDEQIPIIFNATAINIFLYFLSEYQNLYSFFFQANIIKNPFSDMSYYQKMNIFKDTFYSFTRIIAIIFFSLQVKYSLNFLRENFKGSMIKYNSLNFMEEISLVKTFITFVSYLALISLSFGLPLIINESLKIDQNKYTIVFLALNAIQLWSYPIYNIFEFYILSRMIISKVNSNYIVYLIFSLVIASILEAQLNLMDFSDQVKCLLHELIVVVVAFLRISISIMGICELNRLEYFSFFLIFKDLVYVLDSKFLFMFSVLLFNWTLIFYLPDTILLKEYLNYYFILGIIIQFSHFIYTFRSDSKKRSSNLKYFRISSPYLNLKKS